MLRFRNFSLIVFSSLCLTLMGCQKSRSTPPTQGSSEARTIAAQAYIYGYPLIVMDASRAKLTNVPYPIGAGLAPANQFGHIRTFPDASFTDVVSPNADTLYSSAWLDLKKEPIVLSVPDTHGRYYLMPMLDAWTNVFASPGKRTTGTSKGNFVITGPQWTGTLPAGLKEIKSPTDMVWIIGRTQANGKSDFATVNTIQNQYKLTPLSAWGKPYTPPADVPTEPKVDMKRAPVDVADSLDASAFFNRLAALMQDNPPAAVDAPMVAKLASIGVVPGQPFDINKNGPDAAKAIADGVADGKKKLHDLAQNLPSASVENGWKVMLKDIGVYGTNYDARAGIAWTGLGANVPADAFYPMARNESDGNPLNGANKYVIHFDKGQTPPVNAFWSLTAYTAKQTFVDNPLNRYTVGDRDKLKLNPDGSLDIYLQHDSPGKDKESNWLPVDAGSFNIAMRMYWPKDTALNGAWTPPPIKKVE